MLLKDEGGCCIMAMVEWYAHLMQSYLMPDWHKTDTASRATYKRHKDFLMLRVTSPTLHTGGVAGSIPAAPTIHPSDLKQPLERPSTDPQASLRRNA